MKKDHSAFIIVIVSVFVCFGVLIFFINRTSLVTDGIVNNGGVKSSTVIDTID